MMSLLLGYHLLNPASKKRSHLGHLVLCWRFPQTQRTSRNKKSKKKRSNKDKVSSCVDNTESFIPVKEVDLGCCCSCHDSGKPSCGWCEPHHK
mmetsp:Transcript_27141/g.43595  ORF Transcript_27141/g.43595 Transcript_27141/m.43595 type:complete len:93 (+) Transcript_27141:728-1006(+)